VEYKNQLGDNLSLYKDTFPKKWIDTLTNEYHSNITDEYSILNRNWFVIPEKRLGNYGGRNDEYIDKRVSDYFNRLLYGSNIFAIDYILRNSKDFENLTFCDFGSGFGLLSVFLVHLNIPGLYCYNYDTFEQLGSLKEEVVTNKFFQLYGIMPPSTEYPGSSENCKKVDVLYSADITINLQKVLNNFPRFLMIEHWYSLMSDWSKNKIINRMINKCHDFIEDHYHLKYNYGPMLTVYERKS